eukprot:13471363-Alexandrium_andersonii.AAC.1
MSASLVGSEMCIRDSRSALATQPVPAESIQQRRARRAPVLPTQAGELQAAVDQVSANRLGEDVRRVLLPRPLQERE